MRKIPFYYKAIAILLVVVMFFATLPAQGVMTDPPPVKNNDSNLIHVLCVIVIAGIILGIGGCAAKKLKDRPPRKIPGLEDDEPPAPTNAPPRHASLNLTYMPDYPTVFVTTSGTNCDGMIKWDMTQTVYWQTNQANYTYTNSFGQEILFDRLITTSIEASTNLTNWQVVGSRMIWLKTANTWGTNVQAALIGYYDASGSLLNYEESGPSECYVANPDSGISLLPSEVGDYPKRFFRLTSPTNHVGILSQ